MNFNGQKQRCFQTVAVAVAIGFLFPIFAGEKEDASILMEPDTASFAPKPLPSMGAPHIERHSVTSIKHGFGTFNVPKDNFLERISSFEDVSCRSSIEKSYRDIVYLEFRQKQQVQKAGGDWNPTLELAKISKVFNALRQEKMQARRGIASVQMSSVPLDLSAIKSRQIEAQSNPDSVIQACHSELLFSKISKDELRDELKLISKCRIESDSSCHQKWLDFCPSYKIEFLGSQSEEAASGLASTGHVCRKAAEAVVSAFESPMF